VLITREPLDTYTKKTLLSVLVVAIFVFLAAGSTDSKRSAKSEDSSAAPGSTVSEKEAVMEAQDFDFRLTITEISTIKATFTIKNPTDRGYKDFEITCEHYSPSGTKIDSNVRTIYEIVKPKGKKSIRGFDMGFIHSQAKKSSCSITDLTLM
jgi:hypothetical protein